MRDGVVAVLRGDIAMIQSLTVANGNAPIKLTMLARCSRLRM